jgi:soluble lytic murein transglycosylase-like protein
MNALVMRNLFIILILSIIFIPNNITAKIERFNKYELVPSIERMAVKNWITSLKCKANIENLDGFIDSVYINSKSNDLDPHLVLGLIRQESCFDTNAKSFANAKGYMQVIAKWHPDEVKSRDLTNPSVGIEVGTAVLNKYIKLSKSNLKKALTGYSGGANNYYEKVVSYKVNLKKHINVYTTNYTALALIELNKNKKTSLFQKIKSKVDILDNQIMMLALNSNIYFNKYEQTSNA